MEWETSGLHDSDIHDNDCRYEFQGLLWNVGSLVFMSVTAGMRSHSVIECETSGLHDCL